MKRKFIVSTLIALVLVFTIGATGARPAQAAPATQLSDGWMPFTASFPNSAININGLVHVIARWNSLSSSQVQVDLSANLPAAGVTVTTDTGIPYNAFGAGHSSVSHRPYLSYRLSACGHAILPVGDGGQ